MNGSQAFQTAISKSCTSFKMAGRSFDSNAIALTNLPPYLQASNRRL